MAFTRTSAFVFVICALSALAAQPAYATPEAVIVRHDDINQHSEEGARVLLNRIARAAREVCGRDIASRYLAAQRAYRRCTMQTMVRTIDRTGNEALHSAFVTRYGHP